MIYEKTESKKRLWWTLKIADIYSDRLSEGSGRCPKNLQGTRPLTHYRALPEPILAGRQEKGAVAPFLLEQDNPKALCQQTFAAYPHSRIAGCCGIPRFYWQQLRSVYAVPFFCIFRMVCCPRKIRSCHLPGMLSAPCNISTLFKTL